MYFNYSETSEKRRSMGLKNLSVIARCPLLGGNLKKIVTFGTKRFLSAIHGMSAICNVRYWKVSLYN